MGPLDDSRPLFLVLELNQIKIHSDKGKLLEREGRKATGLTLMGKINHDRRVAEESVFLWHPNKGAFCTSDLE